MLDATDLSQWPAELQIEPGSSVRESLRLDFNAVHQDHSHTRKRVVIQFANRFSDKIAPGEALLVDGRAAVFRQRERGEPKPAP